MQKDLAISLILIAGVLAMSCQNAPTRAHETTTNRDAETNKPLKEETTLIDARPPFVSALAKPNGAVSLQWEDFTQKDRPFEGELENDLFPQARRLARLGLTPDSDVLILGRGRAGEGEEGRLAWTLRRMGMKKVRFASLDSIKWPKTLNEAPERENAPIWKPVMDESLEISRVQALQNIKAKLSDFRVLDVRVPSEYAQDPDPFAKLKLAPNYEHLPWTEFEDSKGQTSPKLQYRLDSLGLKKTDTIAVIDERGVGAGGVVLRLRELGYPNAKLWAGGYRELRALAK